MNDLVCVRSGCSQRPHAPYLPTRHALSMLTLAAAGLILAMFGTAARADTPVVDPAHDATVNIAGTANVLEAARLAGAGRHRRHDGARRVWGRARCR